MEQMISVQRALELIEGEVSSLSPCAMPLQEALSLVLADTIHAPADVPSFRQSGMDGYAFALDPSRKQYRITGEVQAGAEKALILPEGSAVRIFTGAPVPEGADTVLKQEMATVDDGILVIADERLRKGDNLRPAGSEIAKGEKVFDSGTVLDTVKMGVMASMGFTHAKVYPSPKVALIVTGNEIQTPGMPLRHGQVYDSSSPVLITALHGIVANPVDVHYVSDDPEKLAQVLGHCLQHSQLVLLTGGVSVGDHDYTLGAFKSAGIRPCFHKVRQKPGKPLLFGMKGAVPVFGLPGNPVSVVTCFYQYVLPALGKLMHRSMRLPCVKLPLESAYEKAAGMTHFLKVKVCDNKVQVMQGQDSYKLNVLAHADAFGVVPESAEVLNAGDLIDVHLFS